MNTSVSTSNTYQIKSLQNTNAKKKRRKRCGIYRRQPQYVWITTVRNPIQKNPWKMTKQTRLPPKQISTRTLESRMATGNVHTGGRRFWRKIRKGKTCTQPQTNTQRKLQSHNRVGRHKKHLNYTRLVLQTKTSSSVATRNMPRNHPRRHCLTKREINLFNKSTGEICF